MLVIELKGIVWCRNCLRVIWGLINAYKRAKMLTGRTCAHVVRVYEHEVRYTNMIQCTIYDVWNTLTCYPQILRRFLIPQPVTDSRPCCPPKSGVKPEAKEMAFVKPTNTSTGSYIQPSARVIIKSVSLYC